jgi:hypothetical protein
MGNPVYPLVGPAGPVTSILADVWAQDLLAISFSANVRNDEYINFVGNYEVVPLDGGDPVDVIAVQPGNYDYTNEVFIVVTPFNVGKKYRVVVSGAYYLDGSVLPLSWAEFVGRLTKEDNIIRSRPSLYDMSPESTMRKILQAIGRSDDLIGGSRSDRITDVYPPTPLVPGSPLYPFAMPFGPIVVGGSGPGV